MLIAELYQSNLLDYFCNQFELLDIKPMSDVNPEMVERILQADYLLSPQKTWLRKLTILNQKNQYYEYFK